MPHVHETFQFMAGVGDDDLSIGRRPRSPPGKVMAFGETGPWVEVGHWAVAFALGQHKAPDLYPPCPQPFQTSPAQVVQVCDSAFVRAFPIRGDDLESWQQCVA